MSATEATHPNASPAAAKPSGALTVDAVQQAYAGRALTDPSAALIWSLCALVIMVDGVGTDITTAVEMSR